MVATGFRSWLLRMFGSDPVRVVRAGRRLFALWEPWLLDTQRHHSDGSCGRARSRRPSRVIPTRCHSTIVVLDEHVAPRQYFADGGEGPCWILGERLLDYWLTAFVIAGCQRPISNTCESSQAQSAQSSHDAYSPHEATSMSSLSVAQRPCSSMASRATAKQSALCRPRTSRGIARRAAPHHPEALAGHRRSRLASPHPLPRGRVDRVRCR
jgi:hypothetical protein